MQSPYLVCVFFLGFYAILCQGPHDTILRFFENGLQQMPWCWWMAETAWTLALWLMMKQMVCQFAGELLCVADSNLLLFIVMVVFGCSWWDCFWFCWNAAMDFFSICRDSFNLAPVQQKLFNTLMTPVLCFCSFLQIVPVYSIAFPFNQNCVTHLWHLS